MAGQTGPFSWGSHKLTEAVQLSGRLIGTGDNLVANIRPVFPTTGGGVPTGLGFNHQTILGSLRASLAATVRPAFALEFSPQLDEDSNRHIERVQHASAFAAAKIWLPWPFIETWRIEAARTVYTTAGSISGSGGLRGLFFEPIVEIGETDPAGALESTLTRVASSPSSSEYALSLPTTDDQNQIITGDLTAKEGKLLHMWSYQLLEIASLELEEGFVRRGEWGQTFTIEVAPSAVDYEADVP